MSEYRVLNSVESELKSGTLWELMSIHLMAPHKVDIYKKALEKHIVNDRFIFSPTWSWWAFFGGPFYYFYRKLYKPAIVLVLIAIVLFMVHIPLAGFLVNVASSIAAKYLYCKKFISDLDISGYPDRPRHEIIQALSKLGGYNSWAIVLGVLFNLLVIVVSIILIFIFAGIGILSTGYVKGIFPSITGLFA